MKSLYLFIIIMFVAGMNDSISAEEIKKSKKTILSDFLGWQPEGQQIVIEDGKIRYEKKQQKIKCWIDENGKKHYSNTTPSENKSVKPCP